jgi:hypothetical protein
MTTTALNTLTHSIDTHEKEACQESRYKIKTYTGLKSNVYVRGNSLVKSAHDVWVRQDQDTKRHLHSINT